MWNRLAPLAIVALAAALTLFVAAVDARDVAANSSPIADVCPPGPATQAPPKLARSLPPQPLPLLLAPQRRSRPPAAPGELIACVGASPIYGASFDHWFRAALLSFGKQTRHSRRAAGVATLDFLVQADWIIDEATALGLSVSNAELHRRFHHLRNEQFPHRREFRSFLHSSGQTTRDLLLRTRIQMLSSRITQHVLAGKHGKQAMHALRDFTRQFLRRGRARTYCRAQFATALICGHRLHGA
jgi:hypothetical protein